MTLFTDFFARADQTGGLGTGWSSYSTASQVGSQFTIQSQMAVTGTGTATQHALATTAPTGADQAAQVAMVNNLGASVGVLLCASGSSPTTINGYYIRHTGTDLAIIRLANSVATSLANVAHTRVAGQYLRATKVGSTITAYIDGVQVLQTTDATYASGTTGLRSGSTAGVQLDNFYGGDVADFTSVPASGATGTVIETINPPQASGIPAWKGLVPVPSGRLLHRGKLLHRLHADFFGPAGAYAPPAWLTATGTATLVGPDTSLGRLELATAATIGATAGLAITPQLLTGQHRAIRIDVEAMSFDIASPSAEFRMGASDGASLGGGLAQLDGAGAVFLYSGGENNRTRGVVSHLGATADQRRQTSVLILPADKEVYLLEDDEVLSWRDGTSTWADGLVTVGLSIKATAAAAVTLRLASMTVSTYC